MTNIKTTKPVRAVMLGLWLLGVVLLLVSLANWFTSEVSFDFKVSAAFYSLLLSFMCFYVGGKIGSQEMIVDWLAIFRGPLFSPPEDLDK